jgi:WD40 repeat protein
MVRQLRLLCWLLIGATNLLAAAGWAAEPTAEPLPQLETRTHTATINRIATDAAGRWAVIASDDKTARVWAVARGEHVPVLRPPQDTGDEGELYAVAISPDGAIMALGGWTGGDWDREIRIYLFECASGRLLQRIPGLPNVVYQLAFSTDGRWLAASLGGNNDPDLPSPPTDYLPHLFGPAGYTVPRQPEELPRRLPLLYAQLRGQ